jgi:methionine synthase I (cobalamin-dependent)
MDTWQGRLREKKLLVCDGAWGTMLSARGLGAEAPESWNLTREGDVLGVAAAYVEAGADIVLTNTFGGSSIKLGKAGLAGGAAEANRRAVELSKEAAGVRAFVFASIGPTGEFVAPAGTLTEAALRAVFEEQADALNAGDPDGFIIESMYDLTEAKAALAAVRERTGLPAAVTMTFDRGPAGFATMTGVRPEQAVEALQAAGADIAGANCGRGIRDIVEIAGLMRPCTDLPLWFKPNAGLPELIDGRTVFRQTPEAMADHVPALAAAGASFIGGCCGSTPDHVRALAQACRRAVKSGAFRDPGTLKLP